MDDAEGRLSVDGKSDRDGVFVDALEVLPRTVDGVDDPDAPAAKAVDSVGVLLAEPAVIRECARDGFMEDFGGADVGFGDKLPAVLASVAHAVAAEARDFLAGLEGGIRGDAQFVFEHEDIVARMGTVGAGEGGGAQRAARIFDVA